MGKILLISGDKDFFNFSSAWLKEDGHQVIPGWPPIPYLGLFKLIQPDVVILDMPVCVYESNELWIGLSFFLNLPSFPRTIVIEEIHNYSPKIVAPAIKAGLGDCFKKPSKADISSLAPNTIEDFKEKIRSAVAAILKEKDKASILKNIKRERIIGDSAALNKCLITLYEASLTDEPILILGEPGTGKELLARAAYENSLRKNQKYVPFSCAALPETLAESELFGYKKGSHSLAGGDKDGFVKLAHQGTLFLDEIGDLSLSIQAKLLRCLQEKEVLPLGAIEAEDADFRLISATNKGLEEMLKKGDFREDFYARIRTFTIHVPPLRERREDIQPVAKYIIDSFCKSEHLQPKKWAPEFIAALWNYNWPENIRGLQNELKSAVIKARDEDTLNIYHLSNEIRAEYLLDDKDKVNVLIDKNSDRPSELLDLTLQTLQDFAFEKMAEDKKMSEEVGETINEFCGIDGEKELRPKPQVHPGPNLEAKVDSQSESINDSLKIKDYMDQAQEKYIRQLLKSAEENKITMEEAAKKAGMSPQKLHRLKRKFQISKKYSTK